MAVDDVHPSVEELTAFTLGTLDEETQASIEAHVAACTSCQERAAVAPPDHLARPGPSSTPTTRTTTGWPQNAPVPEG